MESSGTGKAYSTIAALAIILGVVLGFVAIANNPLTSADRQAAIEQLCPSAGGHVTPDGSNSTCTTAYREQIGVKADSDRKLANFAHGFLYGSLPCIIIAVAYFYWRRPRRRTTTKPFVLEIPDWHPESPNYKEPRRR
jgi:hypothetical protein